MTFNWKKAVACLALAWLCVACVDLDTSNSDSSTGTGGSMAMFTSVGDYLYVVDADLLRTYDVSDSSKTVLKSIIAFSSASVETIFPSDTLLFLGTTTGMEIYSLKDPSRPQWLTTYSHVTSCDPVVVQGDYAYVTLHSGGTNCNRDVNQLEVISLSKITDPQLVKTYTMVKPLGLAIDGNRLFVCDGMDIVVMDATDPLHMTELKRCEMDGTPYDLIAKNNILSVTYSLGLKQYAYDGDSIQEISTLY
jgi:hypothetical protein